MYVVRTGVKGSKLSLPLNTTILKMNLSYKMFSFLVQTVAVSMLQCLLFRFLMVTELLVLIVSSF